MKRFWVRSFRLGREVLRDPLRRFVGWSLGSLIEVLRDPSRRLVGWLLGSLICIFVEYPEHCPNYEPEARYGRYCFFHFTKYLRFVPAPLWSRIDSTSHSPEGSGVAIC